METQKMSKIIVQNFIITTLEILNLSSYDKNQLWSQNLYFTKVFSEFVKMDKNKCPKRENQNTFGKIILHH
jgi:hypothetical protein